MNLRHSHRHRLRPLLILHCPAIRGATELCTWLVAVQERQREGRAAGGGEGEGEGEERRRGGVGSTPSRARRERGMLDGILRASQRGALLLCARPA
jgi:hypothetical protein